MKANAITELARIGARPSLRGLVERFARAGYTVEVRQTQHLGSVYPLLRLVESGGHPVSPWLALKPFEAFLGGMEHGGALEHPEAFLDSSGNGYRALGGILLAVLVGSLIVGVAFVLSF